MSEKIRSSEITDEATYFNRRNFIKAGIAAGSLAATTSAFRYFSPARSNAPEPPALAEVKRSDPTDADLTPNTYEEITNYNNYYEFSTSKSAVAAKAESLVTRPWTVEVGGMVHNPKTFGIEDLLKFEQEERVYRFRCVEAWSMVIPWVGFPLKKLIDEVAPLGSARYVAFQTKYDPIRMQSSFAAGIDFPYVEGLRLDEAVHPLTILATGLYGKQMPNQNGAPIRLVVPWKYGFKSIKSIVKIMLTDREPPTTWNQASPEEYGFFSNVNPDVRHPRWSQASERRIGEIGMRPTLAFNGYGDEVASLYSGMDLKKYF